MISAPPPVPLRWTRTHATDVLWRAIMERGLSPTSREELLDVRYKLCRPLPPRYEEWGA